MGMSRFLEKKRQNRNLQIATFYSLVSFKHVPAKIHFSLLGKHPQSGCSSFSKK
jgi:hypothetical protein